MALRLVWTNRAAWLSSMRRMSGEPGLTLLGEAVGRAAIRTQQAMRQRLESMVYSQPPAAGGYVRTRALMRSVHAAPPGNAHSDNEGEASDMAATSPAAAVGRRGAEMESAVGTWLRYGEYVHEGVNQPSPRPFVELSQPDAEAAMREEAERALIRLGAMR